MALVFAFLKSLLNYSFIRRMSDTTLERWFFGIFTIIFVFHEYFKVFAKPSTATQWTLSVISVVDFLTLFAIIFISALPNLKGVYHVLLMIAFLIVHTLISVYLPWSSSFLIPVIFSTICFYFVIGMTKELWKRNKTEPEVRNRAESEIPTITVEAEPLNAEESENDEENQVTRL